MIIYLVRHAKSDYDWEKWPTDDLRPLSAKGKFRQELIAKGMIKNNLLYNIAWVSPYKRAQETLEIIQKYQLKPSPVIINRDLRVGGDEEKIFILLQEQCKITPDIRILLVGHNPNITSLLGLLGKPKKTPEMRTSDVAKCELTENSHSMIKYYPRESLMED